MRYFMFLVGLAVASIAFQLEESAREDAELTSFHRARNAFAAGVEEGEARSPTLKVHEGEKGGAK